MRKLVARIFQQNMWTVFETDNGLDALNFINSNKLNLVILDVCMPEINGMEVLKKIRNNAKTSLMPVIMLTGDDTIDAKKSGFDSGADEYITKPFEIQELIMRTERLLERNSKVLAANPLTQLPGSPAIKEEINSKIKDFAPFAFLYIDIDNFKAYNDSYGYINGDRVIKKLAEILLDVQSKYFNKEIFAGHVGGDDFVIISNPDVSEKMASEITLEFDRIVPDFYKEEDKLKGCIQDSDRNGNTTSFSFMSLSIAIVTNEKRNLNHYAKIIDVAFEIKRYLKSLKDRTGSIYMQDRRKDR
jgi:diguanylate cyclase (GGDEF)-like protein